jgi:outer membrane lipoprotein carrier protein
MHVSGRVSVNRIYHQGVPVSMNLLKVVVVPLMLLFSSIVYAGEGGRLLDRFLSDTKTMSADFVQTLTTDKGVVIKKSSGKFYLQRPGKFRWNYAQPYEQQIVSDGKKIWIYDVDLQQVTVQKQNASMNATPMALVDGRMELKQAFNVRELDNRDGVYRLELISKSHNSDFKNVVVGLDKTGLRFLQLHDHFDQTTDIVFNALQVNVKLKQSLFDFKPPKGADVFGGS